jgi:5-formyltetrahydrofolate cyclo-ligase
MSKLQLRTELKSRLQALGLEDRNDKSKKACQNLIETPQFQQAAVIMS